MKTKVFCEGKRYGTFIVIEEIHVPYIGNEKNRKTSCKLVCKCDCGNVFYPFKNNVTSGKTRACNRCQNAKKIERIGNFSILERTPSEKGVYYKCRCKCGHEFVKNSNLLRNLKAEYCSKCRPKKPKPLYTKEEFKEILIRNNFNKHLKKKKEVIGKKIGRLKILKFSHWEQGIKRRWPIFQCKCKCGNLIERRLDLIYRLRSCGCLQKERIPKGENNPRAQLTNEESKAIKALYHSGTGFRAIDLANMFNVSEAFIYGITQGKTYKDI